MALAARVISNKKIHSGIAGVRPEHVAPVIELFPERMAAVRPILTGGRLSRLRDLARNVTALFEMLVDSSFSMPWRTTAAIVFALGYFLLATDVIPDVVPVLGFLDDAAVVAEVIYLVSGDLRRFETHRRAKAA